MSEYRTFVQEFKEFALKGNVVDMAVGLVVGAGFGKIISSLVADVLTPPLGLLIGGVDFSKLSVSLSNPLTHSEPVLVKYGVFLQTVFDFTIVSFVMFLIIKIVNKLRAKQEEAHVAPPAPVGPSAEEKLLTEIRDLLAKSRG